jgi:hypothetical protein
VAAFFPGFFVEDFSVYGYIGLSPLMIAEYWGVMGQLTKRKEYLLSCE